MIIIRNRCLLLFLWLGLVLSLAHPSARAETVGEITLDLAPTKENPRNSEGAFVTLKSGRILFIYSQFLGGARDESPARIVSISSEDQGNSWSKTPQVVAENERGKNLMSVSLLRLQSGRIALFYLVKNSFQDCRPVVCFSEDEAQTWSKPKLIFTAPGYFVVNNDRVIQTSTGRLILPAAFHRSRNGNPDDPHTIDYRAIDLWYLSDDEGRTWREANDWVALPAPTRTGLHEPGVVELSDHTIFGWARTDQGCQFQTLSTNQGVNWPVPGPSTIQSPIAPASIKRLPGSSSLLAVFNDHSGDFPFEKGKRTPLVSAISSDHGQTWQHKKLLEDDPKSAFCYTAIHYVGDMVLLAYCAGDPKQSGLDRLRIRRVPLQTLQ